MFSWYPKIIKFKNSFIKILCNQLSFLKKRIFTKIYTNEFIINLIIEIKNQLHSHYHDLENLKDEHCKNLVSIIKENKMEKLLEIKKFVKQINQQWEQEFIKDHN